VLTNGLLDVPKGQLVIQHAKISGTGIGEAVALRNSRSAGKLIFAILAGALALRLCSTSAAIVGRPTETQG
jgi:hypothetical protein